MIVGLLVINLLFLAFSPFLLQFFNVSILLALSYFSGGNEKQSIFITAVFFAMLGILIHVMSLPNLLEQSDDFVTYYNNYYAINHGDLSKLFQFGGGFEIGLPLLHWLFSGVINGDLPYVLKLFHCIVLIIIFLYLCFKVSEYYGLSLKDQCLLFACLICFFKLSLGFYFLRQGYASLFLLLSLFHRNKVATYFLFLLACFFHLASLVIYPLVRFLLFSENKRKQFLFCVFCASLGGVLFLSINVLAKINFSIPFLEKLNFIFTYLSNYDYIISSFKKTIISSLYIIPLILVLSISKKNNENFRFGIFNILSIMFFLLSFSFLPNVTVRVLMPILTFFVGGVYFLVLVRYHGVLLRFIFPFFMLLALNINWVFKDSAHYFNFPPVGFVPFYYVNTDFYESNNIIRSNLPTEYHLNNMNKF